MHELFRVDLYCLRVKVKRIARSLWEAKANSDEFLKQNNRIQALEIHREERKASYKGKNKGDHRRAGNGML